MYKIYCDNELLYSEKLETHMIYDPQLSLEINKAGTFKFTAYPNHPRFDDLKKMRSIITVYNNDEIIFRGRILNIDTGWLNQKEVSCEGELAFLNDSVMIQYKFTSVKAALEGYLRNHNEQMKWIDGCSDSDDIITFKQIHLGEVVGFDDAEISNNEYESTWENIERQLLNAFGGYLYLSHEEGKTYLNYYKEYSNEVLNQHIEFGKNMLDFNHSANGEDIFTGIIPLGGTSSETKERITILSENQDAPEGRRLYLLNNDKSKLFGVILKRVDFNEVTSDDSNPARILKARGNLHMEKAGVIAEEIEINAVDLSILNKDFNSFKLGTNVYVYDKNHGIYDIEDNRIVPIKYQVRKLNVDLLSPDKNKITIGTSGESLTEKSVSTTVSQNMNIQNVYKRIESIETSAGNIKSMSKETIEGIIG